MRNNHFVIPVDNRSITQIIADEKEMMYDLAIKSIIKHSSTLRYFSDTDNIFNELNLARDEVSEDQIALIEAIAKAIKKKT